MKKIKIILISLLTPLLGWAQHLESNRATDWSLAGCTAPTYTKEKIIDAKKWGCDPTGNKDITPNLRKILAKAKPGTTILFPAGTYLIKSSVDIPSGVILKGAGSEVTRFEARTLDLGFRGIFDIRGSKKGAEIAVSGTIKAGVTEVSLGSGHALKKGDWVILTMENDPEVMYTKEKWNQSWAKRIRGQIFQLTGTEGQTLKFDRAVLLDYPEAFVPKIQPFTPTSGVGLEHFSIENFQEGDLATFFFDMATHCWMKGIHSENSVKFHVTLEHSRNCEVSESYFRAAFRTDGGGHGYGVLTGKQTGECLIYNNVFTGLRHSMITKAGANSNVYSYNYSCCGTWDHLPAVPADISIHGHFSYMNLFEGNIVEHINSADFWGPSGPGTTFFRNKITKDNLDIRDHSIRQNAIGNVFESDGDIQFVGPISGALLHGNVVKGAAVYDEGMDTQLKSSLYLETQPTFLKNAAWPVFGPDSEWKTNQIPAEERYKAGHPVPQPKGT